MNVRIPSPLRSYTGDRDVEALGRTLRELIADLDRRFPGIAFRIVDEQDHLRPHMRCFVNDELVRDLSTALSPSDRIQIAQALSGG